MIFSPYQYSMDFIGAQDVVEQLGGFNILNCESTHSEETLTLSHTKKGTTLIKYEEKLSKQTKTTKQKFNHIKPKQSKKTSLFFISNVSTICFTLSSSFSSFFLPILFSLIQFYLKIIIPF